MHIGILSDSHGDADATTRAIRLLTNHKAAFFFHCGDICGDNVLDALVGHPCLFVWGNCDQPTAITRRYVEKLDLTWPTVPVRTELAGKKIAVFHGHERAFADQAIYEQYDYIFYGHTHRYSDQRPGRCRLINPGALYRARPRTCALLDLLADKLTFLQLDTGKPISPDS